MYGVDVARALEMPEMIVPAAPGVTSALGLLQVDLAVRTQRSVLMLESEIDVERLTTSFGEMERELVEKLERSGYSGAKLRRQVDIRYFGQSRYLTVDSPDGPWTEQTTAYVVEAFNREHEREHGYVMPSAITTIELTNLRVVGEVAVEKPRAAFEQASVSELGSRNVYFKGVGFVDVPVLERGGLGVGMVVTGPAIVEQEDSTLVLPPAAEARVETDGSLRIRVQGG